MPAIPSFILKKLYLKGSLRPEGDGFALDIKNTIAPGELQGFTGVTVDGEAIPLERIQVVSGAEASRPATSISTDDPLVFPLGATFSLQVTGHSLSPGKHQMKVGVIVKDVGPLEIPVADDLA